MASIHRAMVDPQPIADRVRRELPHLGDRADALAQAISRLVEAFQPTRVHLFGSQARGTARPDSDLDLLVVVDHADEPMYRLDQRGYGVLEGRTLPIELVFITRDDFDRRLPVVMSLPAIVSREGRVLYEAAAAVA